MSTTATQSETVLRTRLETRQHPKPLSPSGALDRFESEELTPVIGREYPTVNIVNDILNASNSEELVRDLAITSEFSLRASHLHLLTTYHQYRRGVSSSSVPKTTSLMTYKRC